MSQEILNTLSAPLLAVLRKEAASCRSKSSRAKNRAKHAASIKAGELNQGTTMQKEAMSCGEDGHYCKTCDKMNEGTRCDCGENCKCIAKEANEDPYKTGYSAWTAMPGLGRLVRIGQHFKHGRPKWNPATQDQTKQGIENQQKQQAKKPVPKTPPPKQHTAGGAPPELPGARQGGPMPYQQFGQKKTASARVVAASLVANLRKAAKPVGR